MLRELIEYVRNVTDLTEKKGDQVISRAIYKAHYENVLGVFWYDILSGSLDYKSGPTNHDQFEKYNEYKNKNGMVRGRLVKDNDDKNFILIYTSDFEQHLLSGEIINDIYKKVSDSSKVYSSYIVDELGQDLIEENLKR